MKVKDPLAAEPSANFTPARNHCRGAEAPSVAVTDPAAIERAVPEGAVQMESEQSASWPVKVAVPAVPGSTGAKSSDRPGRPAWDPAAPVMTRTPPLSPVKPVEKVL